MDKSKMTYRGCIYLYTNKINGKVYVGQTSNLKQRLIQHKNPANCSQRIDQAINKYGIENFKVEVLKEIEVEGYKEYKKAIDELETFYIHKYRDSGYTLYNATIDGGGNTWATYNNDKEYSQLSDEQKQKISDSLKKFYKEHPNYLDRKGAKNSRAKKVIGVNIDTNEVVERYEYGKELSEKIGMNYSTFKYKMQRGGITIGNIKYSYETNS